MADVEITLKRNNSGTADRLLPTTSWNQVEGKPSTFTPSAHTHDDRYYTETEINGFFEAGSSSDFADGTLVTTDLTGGDGPSWTIEVVGKGYGLGVINFKAEGYNYNTASNTYYNISGINQGNAVVSYIKVLNNGGNLCFWWPRFGYWNSFAVKVTETTISGLRRNRVTSITNSTEPNVSLKSQINLVQNINSSNIGSQSVNYATSAGSATSASNAGTLDGLDSSQFVQTFGTQTVDGQKTFTTYTYFDAGAQIGLSTGTTSDPLYFNTNNYYVGPALRGIDEQLYRSFYTGTHRIADAGNFATEFVPTIKGNLIPLYTGSPVLITASTATYTDISLAGSYSPVTSDRFLIVLSAGSNSTSAQKTGVIVSAGNFATTVGHSVITFAGYASVISPSLLGVRTYFCQYRYNGSTLGFRYPTYYASTANPQAAVAETAMYVIEIYKIRT